MWHPSTKCVQVSSVLHGVSYYMTFDIHKTPRDSDNSYAISHSQVVPDLNTSHQIKYPSKSRCEISTPVIKVCLKSRVKAVLWHAATKYLNNPSARSSLLKVTPTVGETSCSNTFICGLPILLLGQGRWDVERHGHICSFKALMLLGKMKRHARLVEATISALLAVQFVDRCL